MVEKEIIQEWIQKADKDFKFALANYEDMKFIDLVSSRKTA